MTHAFLDKVARDEFKVTDEEIALIGPILRRLRWADPATRAKVQQQHGTNVLPVNFYSNTPSIEAIEQSYEYAAEDAPYLLPQIFKPEILRQTLAQMLEFSSEFTPPTGGDRENTTHFFWDNGRFDSCDAMAYYCFVRKERPATVVEIGSGFSTLVALEAIGKNGSGRLHSIDPFPRPFLQTDSRITLHPVKVQSLPAQFFNDTLRDNDILFIDSTHTVKTGSDRLHLYLRVLPEIRRNLWVHVHDVFLPFGVPKPWLLDKQIFWTEQYLLLAFLLDNPKTSVVYGSAYNAEWNQAAMAALMHGRRAVAGWSFWFRYNGGTPAAHP